MRISRRKMRFQLQISLTVLLIALSSANCKRWNTNRDSIVVDAQYPGSGSSKGDASSIQLEDVSEKAECLTSDGEPGECVTVIRCHPILFSEKGQLRNSGLAMTYAETEDVCSSSNNLDGNVDNKTDTAGESNLGQKVICCSRDRIQHDLRSELEYTTSEPDADAQQTTYANVVVEDIISPTDLSPTVFIENDVVVVESEKTPFFSEAEDVNANGINAQTTSQPSLEIEEPEPLPEVTIQSSSGTEPEVVIPVVEDESARSGCASRDSYEPRWPVFQDYPWLATIQTKAKTGPTCIGSLITESHVLTAALCIHRFNSRDVARMQIRIGFSKRSKNDTFNDYYLLRNASKVIFHKRFHERNQMENNIALVKLDEPIQFDDHVSPIGIFNRLGDFDAGNCTAVEAGWIKYGNRRVTGISHGKVQFIEAPMSDFHLRESLSRVLNEEECRLQLNGQINEKMFCAKSSDFEEPSVSTDFFRWNDGGPLVVKVGNMMQQIGIKSWAYEGQSFPTVYTRVDSYLDWIRNNLKM